jgi:hypothetical protein
MVLQRTFPNEAYSYPPSGRYATTTRTDGTALEIMCAVGEDSAFPQVNHLFQEVLDEMKYHFYTLRQEANMLLDCIASYYRCENEITGSDASPPTIRLFS